MTHEEMVAWLRGFVGVDYVDWEPEYSKNMAEIADTLERLAQARCEGEEVMTRGIRICKNCEFHGDETCQRHTPVTVLSPGYVDSCGDMHIPVFVTTWPKVRDDDWCGEFRRNVS